jgi:hypothetical protein
MKDKVEKLEGRSREVGIKRTIKISAIAASALVQYAKEHPKLKFGNKQYGAYNAISIVNNGAVDIAVALDFSDNKEYVVPAGSMMNIDEIMYQEFNVENLDAGAPVVANKVRVTVIYESPLLRDREREVV